jgi:enolase
MSVIARLRGLEILDSRGRPTVRASCELEGGALGIASVPAGASTGGAEAHELRDGDPHRYGGLGCRNAVRNVEEVLHAALAGLSLHDQTTLDEKLVEIDGTANKSRLGANALLAVSLAFCRAQAQERRVPLFRHMASILSADPSPFAIPRPTINLFSGGKHAGGQIPIQDLLIVPATAESIDEALAHAYAVYRAATELAWERYGMRLLRADEGGLAPPFECVEAMLDLAVEAIERAGFAPGVDVMLALDVASSHFHREGRYHLDGGDPLSGARMIDRVAEWVDRYPIVSVEDGLAEDDWAHWPDLAGRLEGRARVVGDDLLCTSPARIRRAVELGAADTLLLKVNQVGTLSEAAEACLLARRAGWLVTVSARSGETEDDWLADLAVGWGGDQIKIGSITQSERLAKYNRLLEIEAFEGVPLNRWPNSGVTRGRA